MKKHSIVALTLVVFILALVTVAIAAEPYVGSWKLNVAKSKINSGPPNKSQIITFTAQENGLKLVAEGIDSKGKASHGEFAAKFDGKDYPFTGSTDIDTIAIKKIDANTWDEVFKKAGKQIESARIVVSKNGKTITHTEKGKDAQGQDYTDISVYDKQ
jgi:hypothetical protein